MIDDLKNLYQEVILDHSNHPRNFGKLSSCTHEGHGDNPLCGDKIDLYISLSDDNAIEDVKFNGKGCAISIASASLLTEIVKGKSCDETLGLFTQFQSLVTDENPTAAKNEDIDRLQVLAGVKQFPMRIKCATLPWHALRSALEGSGQAKTE